LTTEGVENGNLAINSGNHWLDDLTNTVPSALTVYADLKLTGSGGSYLTLTLKKPAETTAHFEIIPCWACLFWNHVKKFSSKTPPRDHLDYGRPHPDYLCAKRIHRFEKLPMSCRRFSHDMIPCEKLQLTVTLS
jgi:hypothetical protein